MVSYDRIPEKMRRGARLYVEAGKLPGGFLQAVLRDSLTETYGKADDENKEAIESYVMWLYNDIPAGCWDSQKKINDWVNQGGLNGK